MDWYVDSGPRGFLITRPQGHPLDRYLDFAAYRLYCKGECIFTQADPPVSVYYVKSGLIRLSVLRENGDEKTFFIIGANSTFNEAAAFDTSPFVATATALQDSCIYVFDRAVLLELMARDVEVSRAFVCSLAYKVGRLASQVEGLTFLDVKNRVAAALSALSESTGYGPHGSVELPITHQELASIIGASRVAVSRTLEELAKQGAVTLKNRRIIVHGKASTADSRVG